MTSKGIGNTLSANEVMKLREPVPMAVDMDQVDSLFQVLLATAQSEERDTIFHHMTRLYLRGAAGCPGMIWRWSRLNKKYGQGLGLSVKIQIGLLSLFRIHLDSAAIKKVKRAYSYFRT